jgi:hypothetical protein
VKNHLGPPMNADKRRLKQDAYRRSSALIGGQYRFPEFSSILSPSASIIFTAFKEVDQELLGWIKQAYDSAG